ncbi:HEAT repeat-containing protein [Seinonella peptonophila]|uniref:HEAT repeat-containing protein n=1 Tax=Seinonella peptonophila TaxID=112248 RepID=A0A1M4Z8V0_9BACL|nr:HEAT repeat domain-containing protein [Seinonella peptonophila]SHF14212.1 HEAT repeat-containing protein [Seinonella peptonophila]
MNSEIQAKPQYDKNELIKRFYRKNLDGKYDFLQSLSEWEPNDSLKKTLIYLYCSYLDKYIRNEIFTILMTYPVDQELELVYLKALTDSEELIRVNAIEMVGDHQIHSAVPPLIKLLLDRSILVRGTAAIALAQINAKKGGFAIRRRLKYERNDWVRLNFHTSLYLYGDRNKLSKIIFYINHRSYKVRCATANLLNFVSDEENRDEIIASLLKRLEIEKTIAVSSSIKDVIDCIRNL